MPRFPGSASPPPTTAPSSSLVHRGARRGLEDVIDWLKFTESRSERREEARRKGRNRMVALIVVAALVVVGGVGYLWSADMIPGLSGPDEKKTVAAGAQQRDMIVVHLHDTKKGGTSTALLVDNTTTKQGTTVLLPSSLAVAGDDGTTTTLGKSVEDDGRTGTREAIDTLLGTRITGTWRLDTPYLENLVELVGNIEVDTDTEVPAAKKGESPLVNKGEAQTLSGPMAVAYATYRADGEPEAKQLTRFGEVMRATLRKISEDPKAATVTIETLLQVLDPSLPEKDLGASLAKLASRAKVGDYKTALLPVQADGTLTEADTRGVVKDILGGTVKAPEDGAPAPGRRPQRHREPEGRGGRPGPAGQRRLRLRGQRQGRGRGVVRRALPVRRGQGEGRRGGQDPGPRRGRREEGRAGRQRRRVRGTRPGLQGPVARPGPSAAASAAAGGPAGETQ